MGLLGGGGEGGSLEAILHIRNRPGSPVQDILNFSAPHEGHRCREEGSKRHTETKGEKRRWSHGKKGKEREHRKKDTYSETQRQRSPGRDRNEDPWRQNCRDIKRDPRKSKKGRDMDTDPKRQKRGHRHSQRDLETQTQRGRY